MAIDFYMKNTCATCRKAKAYLERRGAQLRAMDIVSSPPPEALLRKVIAIYGVKTALNPRSAIYKEKGLGKKPPSEGEAVRLMLKDPNLIKRPVIAKGDMIVVGFDEGAIAELLK